MTGEKAPDQPQQRLHQMEPESAEHKHRNQHHQKCADRSSDMGPPHFVANRFMKKSVKAASSSSWDT